MVKEKEREIEYWNHYYLEGIAPEVPSSFAKYSISKIDKSKLLLEFGCGNGRDTRFFASNDINVLAIDSSATVIRKNAERNISKVNFHQADFSNLELIDRIEEPVGTVYSRFTLHSISKDGFTKALKVAYEILDIKGLFLIEARTVNDPLYGIGDDLGDNAFSVDHYRRFLEIGKVMTELEALGFVIEHAVEDYTSAWYKEDHAVVLRIFARKV